MRCFNCQQEGHVASSCSWENELADAERLPAQYARCTCRKIIYAWDKGIPCERHRTVAGWHAYYRSEQFPADCRTVRERCENTQQAGKDLRTEAARQVAEARAARAIA